MSYALAGPTDTSSNLSVLLGQQAGADAANGSAAVLWAAASSGKLGQLSPGQLVIGATDAITSDAAIMGNMSPPARVVVGVISRVIATSLQPGQTQAQLMTALKAIAADVTFDLARQVLKEVLTDVALEITKDAVAVVPVIGALVNALVDIIAGMGTATGSGPANKDIAVRRAFCLNQYIPLRGTGPGMSTLPADFFAQNAATNAYGEPGRSSVGDALVTITETPVDLKALRASAKLAHSIGNTSLDWSNDPKLGISSKVQTILSSLRLAMEMQYKTGDGGEAIWPVYIDLVRAEFDAGRMNEKLAGWLFNSASIPIHPEVASPGEGTCAFHDSRPLQQVLDLVRGWRQTVAPFYVQFQSVVAAAEAQAIAAADAAVKNRFSTVQAAMPGVSHQQAIVIASQMVKDTGPAVSPVISIAAGAGLAAGIIALLL